VSRYTDSEARIQALDPTRSFIVQAPAGSGKTSLLTQRFLTLLSGVSCPEEILAITFTKKAAGEMRERILHSLALAREEPPQDPFLRQTWQLAQRALKRNDARGWSLEDNPARLRVLTIDSLCAKLAAGLPILSQFGASPMPTEDASEQYAEAARRTLDAIHEQSLPQSESVARLLLHLDNDLLKVQEQIAEMLARRDKWMRPLGRLFGDLQEAGPEALRAALEDSLSEVVRYHLRQLQARLGCEVTLQLAHLCRFAASHLEDDDSFEGWSDHVGLPGLDVVSKPLWDSFRILLLSGKGQWRKTISVKQGFPPENKGRDALQKSEFKAAKAQWKAVLAQIEGDEVLRQLLNDVDSLPPSHYTDSQWETLQALLDVSRLAAAQLTLVFRDTAKTDFVEVSHRAERALGTDDDPTDLAMALDAKLQHLLVDEFQDTSLGQIELLRRLTAEWIPGEGRTLFLVGDPMQSIYRFRDAEVGLFLQVREHGLGHLNPEPLTLRANFRSQSKLVDWFNQTFAQVFPKADDPSVGSVSYALAESARDPDERAPVKYWSVLNGGDREIGKEAEAETVLSIVERTWKEDPERSIAILTRSRGHLKAILPLLKAEGHRFQGVDLEPLESRPWVRDLLSLCGALSHSGDRLAWLSVLRAPWCGLSSADLFHIAYRSNGRTVPSKLRRWQEIPELSPDGQARLRRVWPVFSEALRQRKRQPLRHAVEAAWIGIGGPASLPTATALTDCETFLRLLEEVEQAQSGETLTALTQKVERLYAQPDVTADGRLQIMTIHKSKGLEFDTVILPGLDSPPRGQEEPLVSWLEWSGPADRSHLLLAPVTEKGQDRDPVYSFVRTLERKKEDNETARLLYVAATRTKRQLHLVGQVLEDQQGDVGALKSPWSGSFLSLLWPALGPEFSESTVDLQLRLDPTDPDPAEESEDFTLPLRRLSDDWKPPKLRADFKMKKLDILNEDEFTEDPRFEWAGQTVKHVGTVVHRILQQIGREGANHWTKERLKGLQEYLRSRLSRFGVPEEALAEAVQRAQKALKESLTSKRGRWILDPNHTEARSEYAISGVWGGRLVRSVVDRTFVDENGVRWVVDYKTGTHEGGSKKQFLDREVERYRHQLRRYAKLMQRLDDRPVRVGLYFPLLKAWREWSVEETVKPQQLEFQFEF
jgi:ATP-dependent helicase/nuclease subunit A